MTTDLLDRNHDADDDLDRRLRAAMADIATGYRPGTDLAQPGRRPRRWVVATAAAAVTALGITGVWALNRQPTGPAATETTAVVPPSPVFGDDFTIPTVEQPVVGVRLDPDVVGGELLVANPYGSWVSATTVASRWFVAHEGNRAIGSVSYSDEPQSLWPNLDQLPSFDGSAAAADIREQSDGDLLWRRGEFVRHVIVDGDTVDLLDAIDLALRTDDLATLPVPDGHRELGATPFATWQTDQAPGTMARPDGGWSVGTFSASDADAELYLSTWALDRRTISIDDGLIVLSELENAASRAIVRVGGEVVILYPPFETTDEDLERAVESIEIVPVDELTMAPLFSLSGVQPIERQEPVAGGEISQGRWLAVDITRPSEATDDIHCLRFLGVVDGFRGCTEPGAVDLTICRHIDGSDGTRFALITTESLDPATVTVTANDEPLDATVEASGGLTFVTTTVNAIGYDVHFEAAGSELCTT